MSSWTLVTVTYNSAEDLKNHWAHESERDYEWIVVDNGSTDGTVELARSLADTCIVNTENRGFSAANNIGLAEVRTPYVGFANPDVRVGSGWQGPIEETLARTGGLVVPQLVYPDGSEQPNARGLPYFSSKIRNRLAPDSERARAYAQTGFDVPTYIAWAMGAGVCARTETFRDLGGWNDDYFLYYEDHELGLRAWKRGLSVVLEPRAQWMHSWQRATTRLDLAAWRSEFGSMSTFFRAHPEFLVAPRSRRRERTRLARRNYGGLHDHLWRPVSMEWRR